MKEPLQELSPMDELRLSDIKCKKHEEDMKRACRSCDPLDQTGDPIDGVAREFPKNVEEPGDLPDLF